tara:strand:+ start:146 stop:295 length:150 start_codon:yes stop_codon:yes gene_type:complete
MEGKSKIMLKNSNSPGGGIGRHKGLKIPRQRWRAGSSPAPGTKLNKCNV